jgi:hypothetical protein
LVKNDIGLYYEKTTRHLFELTTNYVPSDPFKLMDLINDLKSLVHVSSEEGKSLENVPSIDFLTGYPKNSILQLCFWVHRYNFFTEMPFVKTVKKIRSRLDRLESKFVADIDFYEKHFNRWESACEQLKQRVSLFR